MSLCLSVFVCVWMWTSTGSDAMNQEITCALFSCPLPLFSLHFSLLTLNLILPLISLHSILYFPYFFSTPSEGESSPALTLPWFLDQRLLVVSVNITVVVENGCTCRWRHYIHWHLFTEVTKRMSCVGSWVEKTSNFLAFGLNFTKILYWFLQTSLQVAKYLLSYEDRTDVKFKLIRSSKPHPNLQF